jgi:choline dehydrogenase
VLDINKNQFQTAEDLKDLEITKDAIKRTRALWADHTGTTKHTVEETWPGPAVQTDEQIKDFIVKNAWGHHVCCTAAIGKDGGECYATCGVVETMLIGLADKNAVLDSNFKVRGIKGLRVVDASAFPWIPGASRDWLSFIYLS